MARPRKSIEYHLIRGLYRRDRHGPLPGTPPEPAASPPEPHPLDIEVERWSMAFSCGHDFFNLTGLDPFSRLWPRGTEREEAAAHRRFHRAAQTAWKKLGGRFLETWVPDVGDDEVPWALQRFGEPSGPLRKPRRLRR